MIMSTWIVAECGQEVGRVEADDVMAARRLAVLHHGLDLSGTRRVRSAVAVALDAETPMRTAVQQLRPTQVAREWAREGREFTTTELAEYCGCEYADANGSVNGHIASGVLKRVGTGRTATGRVCGVWAAGERLYVAPVRMRVRRVA
jgi:hypothetical protein